MAAKFIWKLLGKDAAKGVLTFNPKKNQWGYRQMGQPLNFTQRITSGQAGRLARKHKLKLPSNLGVQTRARTTPSASSQTPRQEAREKASQITTIRQDSVLRNHLAFVLTQLLRNRIGIITLVTVCETISSFVLRCCDCERSIILLE